MENKLLKMMGWRLSRIDRHLINVLNMRVGSGGVSDWVAAAKIHDKSRPDRDQIEEQRSAMATKWAQDIGLNPNFATTMIYTAILESFRRQTKVTYDHLSVVDIDLDNIDAEKDYMFHRQELLRLTESIAPYYDEKYGQQFGTKVYLDFEQDKINKLIASVKNHDTAIDLGCATGKVALSMAPQFNEVFGYDISPHMINQAQKKTLFENTYFRVADLDINIPMMDNSVSVIIMNLGTASDIRNIDNLLGEIKRVLAPGGKFLLSFYNSESLFSKFNFLPWSTSLSAMVDKEMGILDVTFDSKLYLIYAMPRNIEEIKSLLKKHGLDKNNEFFTHPTISSILPDDIMSTEMFESYQTPAQEKRYLMPNVISEEAVDAKRSLTELDYALSESPLNLGIYIIATGEKK